MRALIDMTCHRIRTTDTTILSIQSTGGQYRMTMSRCMARVSGELETLGAWQRISTRKSGAAGRKTWKVRLSALLRGDGKIEGVGACDGLTRVRWLGVALSGLPPKAILSRIAMRAADLELSIVRRAWLCLTHEAISLHHEGLTPHQIFFRRWHHGPLLKASDLESSPLQLFPGKGNGFANRSFRE